MLSNIEHKLLLGFFAVTLLFSCFRTYDILAFEYNRSVERAELEKRLAESGTERIQFSGCNPCGPELFETLILFQGILLLIALGSTALRKLGTILISVFLLLLAAYGYLGWLWVTYVNFAWSELGPGERPGLMSYLLTKSTPWDFLTIFCIVTLIAIQTAIVVRFVAERVHARLRPR